MLATASALLLRQLLSSKRRRPGWLTFFYQLNLPIPHCVGAIAVLLLL